MSSDRLAYLSQMVELLTSSVSFGERLSNMVHLLARFMKVDEALYFSLDKGKDTLSLRSAAGVPVPQLRIEFQSGQGVVGVAAKTRQIQVAHRDQEGVLADNILLNQLQPEYATLAAFPVADDNFLYGVLLLMDTHLRVLTPAERQAVHLTSLMLAGTLARAWSRKRPRNASPSFRCSSRSAKPCRPPWN